MQARYPKEDVEVEGRYSDYVRTNDDGEERTFHFCPDCGSTVFYQTDPALIAVRIGNFADPSFPPPRISVWEEDQFQTYLDAVYDEQAVEGSLAIDNVKAAELIREKATAIGNRVSQEKLATIVKSLNVVLRRYGFSRNERRNLVGGKIVNPES